MTRHWNDATLRDGPHVPAPEWDKVIRGGTPRKPACPRCGKRRKLRLAPSGPIELCWECGLIDLEDLAALAIRDDVTRMQRAQIRCETTRYVRDEIVRRKRLLEYVRKIPSRLMDGHPCVVRRELLRLLEEL